MYYLITAIIIMTPYIGEPNPVQNVITGPFINMERCQEYKAMIAQTVGEAVSSGRIAVTKFECEQKTKDKGEGA